MNYLNIKLKLIHGDLKGRNVFLNREVDGMIKAVVGDFGDAAHKSLLEQKEFRFEHGTLTHKVLLLIKSRLVKLTS